MYKIVTLSDIHGKFEVVKQNEGNLLLYAGDLTHGGSPEESEIALEWIAGQKKYYDDVVFIAGNHDFFLQNYPTLIEDFSEIRNIHYLQDNSVKINNLTIWGCPVTPTYGSMAFNVDRGQSMRRYWEKIPMDVDIILTHCPPMYIRDQVFRGDGKKEYTGCEDLANHVLHRRPLIHCFGHIHEQHGVTLFKDIAYVNASILNNEYENVYGDIEIYIQQNSNEWQIKNIVENLPS